MFTKFIRHFVKPRAVENKDDRRFIMVILTFTTIADLFFSTFNTGTFGSIKPILIIFIILAVVSFLFAFWNVLQPARVIIPIAGFITVTLLLCMGGIHDDAIGGYYFLLIFTAFLLGRRGLLINGFLNTAAILLIGFAETNGLITTHFAPLTDPSTIISTAFFMVAATLTLYFFVNHLKAMIEIAHRNEQEQNRANRGLKKLKSTLEQRVKDRTAELQALFSSMQDIVIVYDQRGRYLNIADTGSKLFLKPPKDLLGKTIHEVIPKREANRWVNHIQAVLRTQSTLHLEYSLEIDHHPVWFDATVSPMDKETVVWVAHDITTRKKNELIQKTIYGITQAAIADIGIDALYHSIHSLIGELIPAENFYIALLDPATELISFPYYVDQYDQAPIEPTPIQGFTGFVIRTGQPLLANRKTADRLIQQGEVELVGTLGEDWMGTPLRLGERILGVMAAQSYSKAIHFNEEDLRFFEFVSTQVAQAIDRKQRENESFFIGTHDQLTGLYNRTFFEEELSRLEKSRLFPVSIFMIDVDKLKTVNDTEGHPAGDEILRRTAQVLTKSFRSEDMVARIGGDEFVALLPRTDENAAHLTIERIKHFLELDNKNSPNILKISIGMATCEKEGSLADTLKQADDRMYLNKRSKG